MIVAAIVSVPALAPLARAGDPETWRFDPVHSQIVFFVGHLGLSDGVGRLKFSQGWLRFDPDDFSHAYVDATIDLASVDMGDTQWNDAVKAGQFFNVAHWPSARYTSRSVEKLPDDNGVQRGVVHGDLRFQKLVVPVDIEFRFNRIARDPYAFKLKAGFSARAELKRGTLGLTRYQDVVGEDVRLRIEIEGIRDDHAQTDQERNHGGNKH